MPDTYNFLNAEEANAYSLLSGQILKLMAEQLALLRRSAAEKGIIAQRLDDLRSDRGEPFKEENRSGSPWGSYQEAFAGSGIGMESAYLCKEQRAAINSTAKSKGCGWVKGKPIDQKYDNIGLLSGSRGTHFYCRICRQKIGEIILVRS